MALITKLVLIVILAFGVFVIWPRQPSFDRMDPVRFATSQVDVWLAEGNGSRTDYLMKLFDVYFHQLGFSVISSARIAWHQSEGVERIGKIREMAELDRVVWPIFATKYEIIRRDTRSNFDDRRAAWEEVLWRSREAAGEARPKVVEALANQLALVYGREPSQTAGAARLMLGARSVLRGDQPPHEGGPMESATGLLIEAFSQIQNSEQAARFSPQ